MKNILLIGILLIATTILGWSLYSRSQMVQVSDKQLDDFLKAHSVKDLAIFERESLVTFIIKDSNRPAFYSPIRYYYKISEAIYFKEYIAIYADELKVYDFVNHDHFEQYKTLIPSVEPLDYR